MRGRAQLGARLRVAVLVVGGALGVCAGGVGGGGGAGVAWAQAAPDTVPEAAPDDTQAHARQLADEGVQAFDEHDYPVALQKLEQAYALAHVDQIRFNIALCLERLARFREAAVQYEAAAQSTQLSDEQRERASAAAANVRARLGHVRVRSAAGDTDARIDEDIECVVPCTIGLDPGAHVVVAGTGASQRIVRFVVRRAEASEVVLPRVVAAPVAREARRGFRPSWLTWTGVGVATVGLGGTVAFGLRTQSLHDDFARMPTAALADEGERMRDFTNLSIGVAVVGAALVVIDLATGGR